MENISEGRVGYRIQVNTPHDYIVVPASGFIEPKKHQLITINLKKKGKFNPLHVFLVEAHPAEEGQCGV